jgi:type IV secretory pathway TraG/TraD family ATPase VirD4
MYDTFDEPQGAVCRPVLLILDEAGTVGFPSLPHFSSTCAGRNISIWAAMQDLSQLDGLYGVHQARTVRNNMGAKVFFHPEDYATAKSISDTLGIASGYSHSQTLREGEVASEGRAEQGVALLTPQELMGLDDRDILFFYKNLKPGRGLRLEFWGFPLLEKRRAIPAPPVKALPPLPDIPLPSSLPPTFSTWERQSRWPRFPIDPDDFN